MEEQFKNTHKILSDLSIDIAFGRVDSIALIYGKINENAIVSHYDYIPGVDIFSLIGAVETLKTRIMLGNVDIPELNGEPEDYDDE